MEGCSIIYCTANQYPDETYYVNDLSQSIKIPSVIVFLNFDLTQCLLADHFSIQSVLLLERADDDFDPICLKGKIWEFIKEDIVESVEKFRKGQ